MTADIVQCFIFSSAENVLCPMLQQQIKIKIVLLQIWGKSNPPLFQSRWGTHHMPSGWQQWIWTIWKKEVYFICPEREIWVVLPGSGYSSCQDSVSHPCQCVQYFPVSRQCHGCRSRGFVTCTQVLMHAIAHRGCGRVCAESWLGKTSLVTRGNQTHIIFAPVFSVQRSHYQKLSWSFLYKLWKVLCHAGYVVQSTVHHNKPQFSGNVCKCLMCHLKFLTCIMHPQMCRCILGRRMHACMS